MDHERGDVWTGPYNSTHVGGDTVRTLEVKEPSIQARGI